ncbi:Imm41 family immunity protein [Jeotgalibacillus campisalis]|uniref:Uncharacterized protein n=1 Tax=Jeotgalibacillus campisalis TaxID=220754 RepID=A0A0C2RFW1_9BACL|nr:Imm41 family immunity protein [Jeotgalibacillus campisalis]KIL49045.1 hypothetical protein KR50_10800 [Jeotgalibacillus campisalis]
MINNNAVIYNNSILREGSFLCSLVEEATFDEHLFWRYYNSVITLTEENLNKDYDWELVKQVIWTHNRIIKCFLWHHDEKDVYEMENFPQEREMDFLERLDFMFDGFIGKRAYSEKGFGDDLVNPEYVD